MRSCNCVGYMTNPGGRCCMDLNQSPSITSSGTSYSIPPKPVTEEDIRRIIREELKRA